MGNNKIYSMAHRKEVNITCGPDTRSTVKSPYIDWWGTDIGSYKGHKGLDTNGAKMGDTIYALVGGIAHVGRNAAAGNYVYTNEDGLYVEYLHLSKQMVSNGQRIVPGQAVGLQGNTGNVTGPHLHISVKQGGVLVDPTLYQMGILPSVPSVTMTGKVADNYVRLRLSCSTEGVILAQYNKGTPVEIYREVSGWYLLKVGGKYGYIRKDLVALDSTGKTYTVKPGDSFWGIAQSQMGNGSLYQELAEYNGMKPTDTIYPGNVLKIPR